MSRQTPWSVRLVLTLFPVFWVATVPPAAVTTHTSPSFAKNVKMRSNVLPGPGTNCAGQHAPSRQLTVRAGRQNADRTLEAAVATAVRQTKPQKTAAEKGE